MCFATAVRAHNPHFVSQHICLKWAGVVGVKKVRKVPLGGHFQAICKLHSSLVLCASIRAPCAEQDNTAWYGSCWWLNTLLS